MYILINHPSKIRFAMAALLVGLWAGREAMRPPATIQTFASGGIFTASVGDNASAASNPESRIRELDYEIERINRLIDLQSGSEAQEKEMEKQKLLREKMYWEQRLDAGDRKIKGSNKKGD